jgi:malate dehydrogenase (oxaloacetate-decarboxylating)(NADP+)
MQPTIEVAKRDRERLVYAEGENHVVLRAVQTVVDEGIAFPIVLGRAEVVAMRISELGLRIDPGTDCELTDPQYDRRYREYWQFYHERVGRKGASVAAAREVIRTNTTAIAACMVAKGEAEAMICGSVGRFDNHLQHIIDVIGPQSLAKRVSSMSVLILPSGPLFISDTHIGINPTAEQIAETTIACADRISSFGVKPKAALLSHSNFGSSRAASARKMRAALAILRAAAPDLEVDGEMHASAAMNQGIRDSLVSNSKLTGRANLLIMPDLDTANICMELVRAVNDALLVGPVLSGTARPAHIVTPTSTMRGIFNMSAIAVADVWRLKNEGAQKALKI